MIEAIYIGFLGTGLLFALVAIPAGYLWDRAGRLLIGAALACAALAVAMLVPLAAVALEEWRACLP